MAMSRTQRPPCDGKPDHSASGTMILMQVLPKAFYDRDAECVARDVLGNLLVRRVDHRRQIGRIVETEAYLGPHDLAAHSARGRTTAPRSCSARPVMPMST